jgi:hypothetical protein
MTKMFHSFSHSLTAVIAALLIGTTFIAAATGPALMTATQNSDIVA